MTRTTRLFIAALLAIAAPGPASAIPLVYEIEFTALSGYVTTMTYADTPGAPPTWTHEAAAGRKYFGSFAVDSDVLLTDGIGKYGLVDWFFIQMEDNIWGYNLPSDNSFVGFRGQFTDGSCASGACLGGASPGFDVLDGALVNLRGGVFGLGDAPFVDFSALACGLGPCEQIPGTFSAMGRAPLQIGGSRRFVGHPADGSGLPQHIEGTMAVRRVPEPSMLVIFALGLLVSAVMRLNVERS